MKHYETVIIFSPALTKEQAKNETDKYRKLLKDIGAKILHEEAWGDPTQLNNSVLEEERWQSFEKKSTGYYRLFEYQVNSVMIAEFEVALKRNNKVLRFLTVVLDKHD